MRILLILKYVPSKENDLKGDLLWSIVEALENADMKVTLLTDGRVASTERQCIQVRYHWTFQLVDRIANKIARLLRMPSLEYYFLRQQAYKQVSKIHSATPFEAVVAECTSFSPAIIAREIGHRLRIPYVVREHQNYESRADFTRRLPASYVRALREAQCLAAVSKGQAHTIESSGIRNNVSVIPNAISKSFFSKGMPEPAVRQDGRLHKLLHRNVSFGAWTRWREIKRLDLLLEAFSLAFAQNNRIRLIVAGPIEIELNTILHAPYWDAISEAVLFWGPASRADIHYLAHSVDCVVVPSDFETFALPAVEGMAAGKPAIVTRCNGPEGLIKDDRLGVVVDRGRSDQLSHAILYVAAHLQAYDAGSIRQHAIENYSTQSVGRQYADLIRAAVNSTPDIVKVWP